MMLKKLLLKKLLLKRLLLKRLLLKKLLPKQSLIMGKKLELQKLLQTIHVINVTATSQV